MSRSTPALDRQSPGDMIVAENLTRVFRTSLRREGRFGALASLVRPRTREVVAVDGVSFGIPAGECVGYLGPNGAGKSTTIKMLTGILVPTAGRVEVGGLEPARDRQRNAHQIGVVFGHRSQLLFDLPVRDSFELLRYMYRLPVPRYRENLARFAEVLEVGSLLDRPVRTLSLGQRMRCEILAALLHEPRVLFLDEPTIGLDVVAKDRIRAFIEQINRQDGVTVVLTTHDLADIERLCRRVILIDKGKVIYDGELAALRDRLATERQIAVRLADAAAAAELARSLAVDGLVASADGRSVTVRFDLRHTSAADVMRRLLAATSPEDLVMREESIEALVRRVYQEGLDAPASVGAAR